MIDFYTFFFGKVKATAKRKQQFRNAFAKGICWQGKVKDNEGNEIDNPTAFQEVFNRSVCEHIREICITGQRALDREMAGPPDTFSELSEEDK